MAQRHLEPMIDAEGEVRDLTRDEWLWAVRDEDFGGVLGSVAFLARREEVLRAAEAVGIPRAAFLPYEPSKPGFEERVAAAYGPLVRAIGLAAE